MGIVLVNAENVFGVLSEKTGPAESVGIRFPMLLIGLYADCILPLTLTEEEVKSSLITPSFYMASIKEEDN
jgi:hypothetical protein